MLTANRLEKIMELEQELRAEYQQQLDDKQAAIDAALAEKAELQATLDKQLETIKELTGKASDTQKVEQRNRELHNRADNLQGEIAELKQRLKTLQKDLNAVREENKALNQFDPARMKKNLDASKKKLAEKQKDNESLQKALKESRKEQAALERKVAELEAKLAETDAGDDGEAPVDAPAQDQASAA
jgi:chromosome segregation ATPase